MLEPGSKMQLLVLFTASVSPNTISTLSRLPNLILKRVPDLSDFSILSIWTLIEYTVVFFLKPDSIVTNTGPISAIKQVMVHPQCELAAAPKLLPPDCFDTGVLVIRPSLPRFRELLSKSKQHKTEGELLNQVFKSWHTSTTADTLRLPFEFNA